MSEIKRYCCCGDYGYEGDPLEDLEGHCVKFDDHLKELESSRLRIKELEEVVHHCRDLAYISFVEQQGLDKLLVDIMNCCDRALISQQQQKPTQ